MRLRPSLAALGGITSLALLACLAPGRSESDARGAYDVEAYRLDLTVDPAKKKISGSVEIDATVSAETLRAIELDAYEELRVTDVTEFAASSDRDGAGAKLAFRRSGRRLVCDLPRERRRGERVRVVVAYEGEPKAQSDFDGVHWKTTADGKPWISTSCQMLGSSYWWPSKDSFFHPEDKPERIAIDVRVPKGLVAVANGRLVERTVDGELETFHWLHEYPLETYSVALAIGPYVEVARDLDLPGLDAPLAFHYWVLPENAEKAALQFQDVPRMLAIYSEAFGPYPFPRSKYALVETSFWGMEHSTAVAYGSSYPAWIAVHGGKDPYASMNKRFDYILVHESAHEWWGNAVSAKSWGHFWLHEGFGCYAEGVYLEKTRDRDAADAHFGEMVKHIGKKSRLYRGDDVDCGHAYILDLYYKGACVLNTLRHCVDDDDAWWRTLAKFNLEYRYKNATTEDFRAVLERESGKPWKTFFDQWVYGTGYPKLEGTVRVKGSKIAIEVENEKTDDTAFEVPLDLAWREGDRECTRRVMLAPGENDLEIECANAPTDVRVVHLDRVLGMHDVKVK